MASILDFDAIRLSSLLENLGLRKAWLSILRTNLVNRPEFEYILANPEFEGSEVLAVDLLDGLSIGEVSVLYEFSLAIVNHEARKESGQFFTPDDVAQFMASFSKEFPAGVWLDPCSGVGNLTWHLVATQNEPEVFLLESMVVCDRDELALFIARTLLTRDFQNQASRLFDDLEHHFIKFDFLSVAEDGIGFIDSEINDLDQIPSHDFAILNPPYLATERDFRFETASASDLYSYFLENVIKTSSGFISVTPQSFTNAEKFRSLRRLLLKKFSNLKIFTFDNVPGNLFRGIKFGSKNSNTANSIRAAITVALPGHGSPQITPLLRWRNSERSRLFAEANQMLGVANLTEDFFPKLGSKYTEIFDEMANKRTLRELTSQQKTAFPLFVPTSPRYFISALLEPVKRASIRTLYFSSEDSRNRAYLILNSSLAYWWWRVRDGGMTLSQETLLTTPVPEFEIETSVLASLLESETKNKVYKMNAGAAQENVKHPVELVAEVTRIVAPSHAELLLSSHQNSSFHTH